MPEVQVVHMQRSVLLQLMGFPRDADTGAGTLDAPVKWSAVVDRLATHPEEAAIRDPGRLELPWSYAHHRFSGTASQYPLTLALVYQLGGDPITKQALEAFIDAFPDIVTKPRS